MMSNVNEMLTLYVQIDIQVQVLFSKKYRHKLLIFNQHIFFRISSIGTLSSSGKMGKILNFQTF